MTRHRRLEARPSRVPAFARPTRGRDREVLSLRAPLVDRVSLPASRVGARLQRREVGENAAKLDVPYLSSRRSSSDVDQWKYRIAACCRSVHVMVALPARRRHGRCSSAAALTRAASSDPDMRPTRAPRCGRPVAQLSSCAAPPRTASRLVLLIRPSRHTGTAAYRGGSSRPHRSRR